MKDLFLLRHSLNSLKKLRPMMLILSYAGWVVFVRLITLTLITYFSISPTARFQDINDAFSSNEVSLMGLSSLLFVALIHWLNPLNYTGFAEVISRDQLEKGFFPSFVRGSLFAAGLVVFFVLTGVYRYLGYFIPLGDAPVELGNVLLRMLILATFAYCEAYLIHFKLRRYLSLYLPELLVIHLTAFLYCGIKLLQFDIGIMHLITLYLISVSLSYRAKRQFSQAAGFLAALLIVFHPLLSLPIFGNSFSGVLLVKPKDDSSTLIRFLSGGAGGPFSSLVFQVLLILDISRSMLRQTRRTYFFQTKTEKGIPSCQLPT